MREVKHTNDCEATDRSPPTSLVFVHLSDLHFREAGSALAQREGMLRSRLLDDIPRVIAFTSAKEATAVLITGDIARSGQLGEYVEARTWLDILCGRIDLDPTQVLTCPGNHDVDWNRLTDERKTKNAELRACKQRHLDLAIDEMLAHPDEVLAPMEPYQEFAAGCACDVQKFLSWELPPLAFAGGYLLAIRGASSVVNSDCKDSAGTMAVQRNQLQVNRDPGVIRMLLIHHSPYFWRREKPSPGKCGNNIVLYGHTHEPDHQVINGTCLEITAGAVHPEETEDFAVPSYNVIEISVEEPAHLPDNKALARIRVHHREFASQDDAFVNSGPEPTIDETVAIIRAVAPDPRPDLTDKREQGGAATGDAEQQPPLQTAAGTPDPFRVVLVRYQRLGAGDRLRLLDRIGILRNEITRLAPHKQIREVARRVITENKLHEFLVAASDVEGH